MENTSMSCSKKNHDEHSWQNGKYVLECLLAGNKRFANSQRIHPNQTPEYRSMLNYGQNPIATILGCSDSRVPPEIIFDKGLGDLFVIRTAGHVLDSSVHASIEYAVKHLGTSLVMILAHSFCGAVTAALTHESVDKDSHLDALLTKISPILKQASAMPGDVTQNAIKLHAKAIMNEIKSHKYTLKNIEDQKLEIVAAYYDIETGTVEILD